MKPLLEVRNLRVYYHTPRGPVKAVNGVNFDLKAGERFGLIGESGSGKSTIALSLLRLTKPPGYIESGEVWLDGLNVMILGLLAIQPSCRNLWWWLTPVLTLICLFLSLYLIHLGFDEVSNPRLRSQG